MILLLVRLFLAPCVIFLASWLATRLGPRWAGFFVGLPTTSLPFLCVIWLAHGHLAATTAAAGGLCGQVTCTVYCIAYARTAPRLGPVPSTLAALALAVPCGMSMLLVHDPIAVVVIAFAVAMLGLVTWPGSSTMGGLPTTRRDVVTRMVLAGGLVAVTSLLAPVLGTAVAGALASLPLILTVMCPSVHRTHGSSVAVAVAHGTLRSIPGTAAFLCVVAVTGPRIGMLPSLLLGVGLLTLSTWAVGRGSDWAVARRRSAALVA